MCSYSLLLTALSCSIPITRIPQSETVRVANMCKTCVKNVFNLSKSCVFYLVEIVDKILVRMKWWKKSDFSTVFYKIYSQVFLIDFNLLINNFSTFSTGLTATITLLNNKKGSV